MDTRLKGQEVVLRLTRQGRLESQITAITDYTLNFDMATLEEGYVGEKSNRFDDVLNGCSGSFNATFEGPEALRFIDFIMKRAMRDPSIVASDARINLTARFNFPDGRRPLIVVSDLKFDAIPVTIPGRTEYVKGAFSFKAGPPRIRES